MIFQQFGGINGISFYASETFASAGNSGSLQAEFFMLFCCLSGLLRLLFFYIHFISLVFLILLNLFSASII